MVRQSLEIEGAPQDREGGNRPSLSAKRKTWTAQRLSVASASVRTSRLSIVPPSTPSSKDLDDADAPAGLTFLETIANFVIGLIGCGTLCLPCNARIVGGAGALLLLALCQACIVECALRLNDAIDHAELISGKKNQIGSYEDIAGEAFGLKGQVVLGFLKNTFWVGVLIVFTIITTEGFVGLLPRWLRPGAETVRWFVVYPIFLAGSMLKDLQALAPIQPVVIGAAFVFSGCLVLGSLSEYMWNPIAPPPTRVMFAGTISDVGTVMSTSFFAGGGFESMGCAVRSQMAEPERLPSAMRLGMAIVVAIQASVVCSAYLAYGEHTADVVTDNVSGVLATVAGAAVQIKLCLTVPTFMYLITSVFEAMGDLPVCMPMSLPNMAFRAALMTAIFLAGMVLPHVREVVGLLAASIGITMSLLIPLATYYTIKRRLASSPAAGQAPRGNDARDYAVHGAVLLISACVAYFGITGAWEALNEKMQAEAKTVVVA